jgi:hypothetical protein
VDIIGRSGCGEQDKSTSLSGGNAADCPGQERQEDGSDIPVIVRSTWIDPDPGDHMDPCRTPEAKYEMMNAKQFWFTVQNAYHFNIWRAAEKAKAAAGEGNASSPSPIEQPATPDCTFYGWSQEVCQKRDGLRVPTPVIRNGLFEQWIFEPCQIVMW